MIIDILILSLSQRHWLTEVPILSLATRSSSTKLWTTSFTDWQITPFLGPNFSSSLSWNSDKTYQWYIILRDKTAVLIHKSKALTSEKMIRRTEVHLTQYDEDTFTENETEITFFTVGGYIHIYPALPPRRQKYLGVSYKEQHFFGMIDFEQ